MSANRKLAEQIATFFGGNGLSTNQAIDETEKLLDAAHAALRHAGPSDDTIGHDDGRRHIGFFVGERSEGSCRIFKNHGCISRAMPYLPPAPVPTNDIGAL